jgi:dipeptidyl aminopeptidase/acylaminoacyl peptidase
MGDMIPPAGVGPNGSLYYRATEGLVEVMTATLDPVHGSASVPSPAAQHVVGNNLFSDWSPDGRHLVYTSRRGQLPFIAGGTVLMTTDLRTGEERILTSELANIGPPRWSPDGRSIIALADDPSGLLHRIDVATGARQVLMTGQGGFRELECTPDGRAVIFVRGSRVIRRDVESGEERQLFEAPPGIQLGPGLALSRDGSRIAVAEWPNKTESQLVVVPAAGGDRRTLFSAKVPDTFAIVGWSPADADVFISSWKATSATAPRTLLRLPLKGGPPVPTGLVVPTMRNARISPDGLQVAFTQGWPTRAVYVLDNFLPPPRSIAARKPTGQ